MKETKVSWLDFKRIIEEHIKDKKGPRMCRGQSDVSWKLKTTFHRNSEGVSFAQYFELIPFIADWVSSNVNKTIDVSDNHIRASFLATLQHNGFPTPLLDWTLSPYIAAYFAFSDVNDSEPTSDQVAIYIFDYKAWTSKWHPVYDYTDNSAHVSVLSPQAMGNLRQINQQGLLYMFTNRSDIESHIIAHEEEVKVTYLTKFLLDVKEKPFVMSDLEVMGIQAYSLFGGVEGICRYFKESIFRKDKVGQTPTERMSEFLKNLTEKSELKS